MSSKVKKIVTDRIIESLESGVIPWEQPWANYRQANYKSRRDYTGVNQILLQMVAHEKGYKSPYWLTYNQSKNLGSVKGQKSVAIIFYKKVKKKPADDPEQDDDDENDSYWLTRYYRVFNAEQVDGLELEQEPAETLKQPQALVSAYLERENIKLSEGGNRASYSRTDDSVSIPAPDQFENPEARYGVLFHELTHSTGHKKRLGRFKNDSPLHFGSVDYSKEELIAEIGSNILSSLAGVKTNVERSAAYIKNWLEVLDSDRSMIISAASKADKAIKYVENGA